MISPCNFFILMRTTQIKSSSVYEFDKLMKRALIKWSWGKCFKIKMTELTKLS